jgi:hypothetical protein
MTSIDPAEAVDYGELSAAELAKLINDEYGLILSSERTNLKRAKAIGEKLTWLQTRATHGEWQSKLEVWCPKLSYETANKYIRVHVKWPEIEQKAAIKNVVTTDLTIDAALKLLAKPSKTNNNASASKAVRGGVQEPGMEPQPRSLPPDQALEGLANDEVFHTLQNVYENRQDELMELTTKLARHFGMTLMPLATTDALMEAIAAPATS